MIINNDRNTQMSILTTILYTVKKMLKPFLKPLVVAFRRSIERSEIKQVLSVMQCRDKDFSRIVDNKLLKLLYKAYRDVPYWQQYTVIGNVCRQNVRDTLMKLPTLTKDKIRKNGASMWKKGCSPDNHSSGSTGGTTGQPLVFLCGHAPEDTHQKALYEYMIGLKYYGNLDRSGALVSFDGTRPSSDCIDRNIYWTIKEPNIYGSYHFCSFYLSDDTAKYYIHELNELQPLIMRGYSNAILSMASYVHRLGGMTFALKGIYVTSEYCSKESMQYISNVFGCPCFGQYGQSEGLLFAWTRPNDDSYYCSPLYGYVEVLDENDSHVKIGESGEVVVTGYYTTEQPFIRYRTGDIAVYGGCDKGIVVLSQFKGRNNDYIVGSNNEKIMLSGYLDIHYFKCRDKIISYQMEQFKKGEIIFRIVRTDDWTDADECEIKSLLAIKSIDVVFEYTDHIPLTERGKRKNIIRHFE